jgi:hypothetical protein
MLPLVQCNITIKDQKNPRNPPKEFGRGSRLRQEFPGTVPARKAPTKRALAALDEPVEIPPLDGHVKNSAYLPFW